MHEFTIARNIVDIAADAATRNNVTGVISVEVEVGQASGIVPEALEFAWESARKDTILQEASLVIRIIAIGARCRDCGREFHPESIYEICPACGAYNPEIISGRELRVIAIQA